MKHQIYVDEIHTLNSESEFFKKYLGGEIENNLNENKIFKKISSENKKTFRKIIELYATHCPQFDHVIRRDALQSGKGPSDINGNLLMYFGVQSPLKGTQSQFLALALGESSEGVNITFYIAGSGDSTILASKINESASTRNIHNLTVGSMKEYQENINKITDAAKYFNDISKTLKHNVNGFTPKKCLDLFKTLDNKSIEERMVYAKNEAYKFWNSIADAGLKKHIKDNKNGYEKAINLIFSGYETSKSFAEIFEATNSKT